MDISMPVMDGIEATRQILRVFTPAIVILTAYGDEQFRAKAIEAGATGYIVKPIIGDIFLPELRSILRRDAERSLAA